MMEIRCKACCYWVLHLFSSVSDNKTTKNVIMTILKPAVLLHHQAAQL